MLINFPSFDFLGSVLPLYTAMFFSYLVLLKSCRGCVDNTACATLIKISNGANGTLHPLYLCKHDPVTPPLRNFGLSELCATLLARCRKHSVRTKF